jgi:hypothetical protein
VDETFANHERGKLSMNILKISLRAPLVTGLAAVSMTYAVPHRAPVTYADPRAPIVETNLPLATGTVESEMNHGRYALDVIGSTYVAGSTWYDTQHFGSEGRMIVVDDLGFVQVVWMKGMNAQNNLRHVFANLWDPAARSFMVTGGGQIDGMTKAGFITQAALPAGWCFPAFHFYVNGTIRSGVGIDYRPHMGIFNLSWPVDVEGRNIGWPQIAIGRDSTLHMVTIESPSDISQRWERVYYSRGRPVWDAEGNGLNIVWDFVGGQQYALVDTVILLSPIVACSPVSNRVAIVLSRPRTSLSQDIETAPRQDNDIVMYLSEDGGRNWSPRINLTNFAWADYDCLSGDTAVCDRDTFRSYDDCSALFDLNDRLHVAFSTLKFWSLEGTYGPIFSDIWHWDEQWQEFSPIAHAVADTLDWITLTGPPMVRRPTLSLDRTTGNLYCAYQWFDSIHSSQDGCPQGDVMAAVSRNGGRTWSVSTNLTETGHASNPPRGECQSERDITVAERVTYENGIGYLHVEYELDLDACDCAPSEGCTNNPIIYQRVPVDSIPALPLVDWTFPILHADSTGMPGRVHPLTVEDHQQARTPDLFALYQNYPNPFNPTTTIRFDLSCSAPVTLNVFNVLGENVATLYDHQFLTAGVQTATFDGARLASGVYVVQLTVNDMHREQKMVLIR